MPATLLHDTLGRNLGIPDNEAEIRYNSASAGVFTIRRDSIVPWPDDAVLTIYVVGAGLPSFAAGAGVTLRGSAPTVATGDLLVAIKVGPDEWALRSSVAS